MTSHIPLPPDATRPFNRCNLPSDLLGSVDFQGFPIDVELDGVAQLHHEFLKILANEPDLLHRAEHFRRYMRVTFQLDHPEAAGHEEGDRPHRIHADYLKILRGWSFNADGIEAAVIKGWVESRFGLSPRRHKGSLSDNTAFAAYQADWAKGLIGTNALEAQLDVLYAYCQFELAQQNVGFLTLYRGVNKLEDFEILCEHTPRDYTLLLNNMNSFSRNRETAGEFGDYILCCSVPRQKVFCHDLLIPGRMAGEEEVMVIGGAYATILVD